MKRDANAPHNELRQKVRELRDPLQELIDSLPAALRPENQEEYLGHGSEMGIDFTDRWDSGPPWPGEWNNKS